MPIEQNYINQRDFLNQLKVHLKSIDPEDQVEKIRINNLIIKTRNSIKRLLGINQRVCFIKLALIFKDGTKDQYSFCCLAETETEVLSIINDLNNICPMQNPVIEATIIGKPKIIKLCTLYNSN